MEDSVRDAIFSAVWFGVCRNSQGTLDTDKLFTGQRLDDTGLYYYNARYYDATIGRFISADTIVPNYMNPQSLNRYSYCDNNPLKHIDPSGHFSVIGLAISIAVGIATGGQSGGIGGIIGGAIAGGGSSGGNSGGSIGANIARTLGLQGMIWRISPNIQVRGNTVFNPLLSRPGGSRWILFDRPHQGVNSYHFNSDLYLTGSHTIGLRKTPGEFLHYWAGDIAKWGGRACFVGAVGFDAYNIYSASQLDQANGNGAFGPETQQAVGSTIGSWSWGLGGGYIGGLCGGPGGALIVGFTFSCIGSYIGGQPPNYDATREFWAPMLDSILDNPGGGNCPG